MTKVEKTIFYILIASVAFLGYLQQAKSTDIQLTANAYNTGYSQGVKAVEAVIIKDSQDGVITIGKDNYKKEVITKK